MMDSRTLGDFFPFCVSFPYSFQLTPFFHNGRNKHFEDKN